ncbi:hypothetical protein SAXI111661_21085 [Saccharomonospora xinjiangensis]|uniref:hypothetical protein n=1 Tax=Saccharomonospora xinjiangensis TaxID=75294 RepID=UPI00106F6502|nr:hypothetical protein [Saccharomonospora xinjiangensis]QBQ61917.1 hypothetical protein EYD13_17865 [Saccharomonospora xinjiangensis]
MDLRKGALRRNTAAVQRLKRIADTIDELDRDLDRVEFLEDDIVEKKDFDTATDLAGKVRSALRMVRGEIGKKSGGNVAKGYKK